MDVSEIEKEICLICLNNVPFIWSSDHLRHNKNILTTPLFRLLNTLEFCQIRMAILYWGETMNSRHRPWNWFSQRGVSEKVFYTKTNPSPDDMSLPTSRAKARCADGHLKSDVILYLGGSVVSCQEQWSCSLGTHGKLGRLKVGLMCHVQTRPLLWNTY